MREQCAKLLAEREMWKEAAEQMEICLRHDERPSSLRQLARLYRNAGMYRQTAICCRKLLRSSPRDKRLLANLVYCLDRMGEKASAIALIQEANKVLKPYASLLLIEGRLCLGAGNTEKALALLSRTESLFPDDPRPCEEMAAIYRKRKVKSLVDSFQEKARELCGREEAKKAARMRAQKRQRPRRLPQKATARQGFLRAKPVLRWEKRARGS